MLKRTAWILGFVFVLTLTASAADDHKATFDALKKLASMGDEMKKAGEAEAKKKEMDLEAVMHGFKLRSKGGIGFAEKASQPNTDGIEAKIIALSKKALTKKEAESQEKDLVTMAQTTAAIAAVAIHKCPVDKKTGDKDPAQWKKWHEDMYDASMELAKAAKDKDLAGIKTAATKLNGTCTSCHGPFRD